MVNVFVIIQIVWGNLGTTDQVCSYNLCWARFQIVWMVAEVYDAWGCNKLLMKRRWMRVVKWMWPFWTSLRLLIGLVTLFYYNEYRDLGITTDQHLRWNLHMDKVLAKANRMLGLIKRSCRDFEDRKTLRTL